MARHRSPRGRRAHPSPSPQAVGHAVQGAVARRSVPTPLRRGVAVVTVTGGALALIGATVPIEFPDPAGAGTAFLPAAQAAATPIDVALLSSVEPVTPEPELLDAGELVKAVRLVEQETSRLDAERAAQDRAADDRAARDEAAHDKAAQELAARATATATAAATATRRAAAGNCGLNTSGLGAVKPHVRAAAEFLGCRYGEPTMIGVASRAGASDHPSGKAVDFMVDRATGDGLAECALRNRAALGITYVIWRQRINFGSGWQPMEDRGGVTANHLDHVHISFGDGAGNGDPTAC